MEQYLLIGGDVQHPGRVNVAKVWSKELLDQVKMSRGLDYSELGCRPDWRTYLNQMLTLFCYSYDDTV